MKTSKENTATCISKPHQMQYINADKRGCTCNLRWSRSAYNADRAWGAYLTR